MNRSTHALHMLYKRKQVQGRRHMSSSYPLEGMTVTDNNDEATHGMAGCVATLYSKELSENDGKLREVRRNVN